MSSRESALLVAFVALFVAIGLWAWLSLGEDSNPLDYPVPQQVVNDGPFSPGGVVEIFGIKCNVSDQPVHITGSSFWKKQGDGSPQNVISHFSGSRVLEPKCIEQVFENVLPENMPSGFWRLEGEDCVDGKRFCAAYFSDTFEVE